MVVDTNVVIGALLRGEGTNRDVLRLCLRRRAVPVMGHRLFLELEALLGRKELFANCPLRAGERRQLVAAYLSVCSWVEVYYLWRPNLPDDGDNHILELAVAGHASAIVTHNTADFERGDLLFPEIRILKPKQLIKELS